MTILACICCDSHTPCFESLTLLNCKCDTFVYITSPTQLQDGTTYDSNNIIHHICMKSISKLFVTIQKYQSFLRYYHPQKWLTFHLSSRRSFFLFSENPILHSVTLECSYFLWVCIILQKVLQSIYEILFLVLSAPVCFYNSVLQFQQRYLQTVLLE